MKIIIHIDEKNKWSMVLNNLKHLTESYHTPDDQIELLVNGEAVTGVQADSDEALEIQNTLTDQTTLVVCQNSLNQREISVTSLLPSAIIIESGVVELVEKQAIGFHYLRP